MATAISRGVCARETEKKESVWDGENRWNYASHDFCISQLPSALQNSDMILLPKKNASLSFASITHLSEWDGAS